MADAGTARVELEVSPAVGSSRPRFRWLFMGGVALVLAAIALLTDVGPAQAAVAAGVATTHAWVRSYSVSLFTPDESDLLVGAGTATNGSNVSAAGGAPAWATWATCWARGHWRRMRDDEAARKAAHYALPVPLSELDNYSWAVPRAPGCPKYRPFDGDSFCAALRGRDVVMIGDSLTGQFASALTFLVNGRRPPSASPLPRSPFPYTAPTGVLYTGCTDWGFPPSKFVNLLNWAHGNLRLSDAVGERTVSRRCNATGKWTCKHVVVTPGSPEDRVYGVDEFLTVWAPAHGVRPGVILVNKGAHYDPDAVLLKEARAALAFITQAFPNATVVWRNTVPGHVNCSRIAAPLSALQDLAGSGASAFHWADFAHQNELMREVIAREFPSVIYMDVYSAGVLRGDFHMSFYKSPPDDSDCLHYRPEVPSPLDHWAEVLYNVLRQANRRAGDD